jgi:hypothetical protein
MFEINLEVVILEELAEFNQSSFYLWNIVHWGVRRSMDKFIELLFKKPVRQRQLSNAYRKIEIYYPVWIRISN